MKGQRKSVLSYIPGLTSNAVLKLIIFCAGAYAILAVTWAITMIVYQGDNNIFEAYFMPDIAIPPSFTAFKSHWWTLLTYGIFHKPNTFFELLSDMLWLYCFGSVVQMLVGHRQVIPLFLYGLVIGGLFYILAGMLPGELGKCPPYILGPRAAMMGMAAAAVTLTPKYRFYLTDTFSIPLMVVAGIFAVLMFIGTGFYLPVILMLAGGAFTGWGYIRLLHEGYRPGQWMYTFTRKMESLVTPNEQFVAQRRNTIINTHQATGNNIQKRVDDILDKINQKGYNSLTSEEKRILMQAGKE